MGKIYNLSKIVCKGLLGNKPMNPVNGFKVQKSIILILLKNYAALSSSYHVNVVSINVN